MTLNDNNSYYLVSVFEPGVDPGGYQTTVTVQAKDKKQASRRGLRKARDRFPENTGLEVWEVKLQP